MFTPKTKNISFDWYYPDPGVMAVGGVIDNLLTI